MRVLLLCLVPISLSAAACDGGGEYTGSQADFATMEVAESTVDATDSVEAPISKDQGQPGASEEETAAQNAPQIAYSYSYGFRLDGSDIPALQEAHVTLCRDAGPQNCRMLNQSSSGDSDDYAYGRLELEVVASKAQEFGQNLTMAAEVEGAERISYSVTGEDLSKQISDTGAKLRAKRLLAERLSEILRTKSGNIADLVEAERALSEVNSEIDRLASWLAEMRGRVAFSKLTIRYDSNAPGAGSFSGPVRLAWNSSAAILGTSIAAVMTFTIAALPWVLLLFLAIWLRKRFKSPDRTFWGRKIAGKTAVQATDNHSSEG
ncbi:MAG: DUF4349 domain-containing protein [Pseudomonadota bacterium]